MEMLRLAFLGLVAPALMGFRDVKVDFGAKGDGTSDDTSSIQSAIDTVSSEGGGILFFPPGTYVFATRGSGPANTIIALKSNITFQGSGRGATTLQLNADGARIPISSVTHPVTTTSATTTIVTTSSPHGFVDGAAACLADVGNGNYNGCWNPITKISDTKFSFQQSGAGLTSSSGGTARSTFYSQPGTWVYWFSTADAATQNLYGTYSNIVWRDMTIDINARNGNRWNAPGSNRATFYLPDVSNVAFERVDFIDTDVGNSVWIGTSLNRARNTRNFRVVDCTFDGPTSNDTAHFDMSQIVTIADNSVITGNRFINTQGYSRGRVLASAVELHGNNSVFTNNVINGYRQVAFVAAEIDTNPLLQNVEIAGNLATDLNTLGITLWADGIPPWASGVPYGVNQWVSNSGNVYKVVSTPDGLPTLSGAAAPRSSCAPPSNPPTFRDSNGIVWQCVPGQPTVREIRGVNIHDNTFAFQPTSANVVDGSVGGLSTVSPTTGPDGAVGATNQVQFHHNQIVYTPPPNWTANTTYPVIGTTIGGTEMASAGSNGPLVTIPRGPVAGQVFRAVPPQGTSASSGNGPTGCPIAPNGLVRSGITVTATCLWPYTHGYTAGRSVVDVNYPSAGPDNFPAVSGVTILSGGAFSATVFQYRQSGSPGTLGDGFTANSATVDGTAHWNRMPTYESNNSGVATTFGGNDWVVSDNVFRGFNDGVGLWNLSNASANFNNIRIRANRFVEGSTSAGNNSVAVGCPPPTSCVVSNLSIEDNEIINIATAPNAPATPMYIASSSGAANYRVTNNQTVGFIPSLLGCPTCGAMVTLAGSMPAQMVVLGSQNFEASYSADPAFVPDMSQFQSFTLTFGSGGAPVTISNPAFAYQGQQMRIELVNSSGGDITPSWDSRYFGDRPVLGASLANNKHRTYIFQARHTGRFAERNCMDQVSVSTDVDN